MPEETIKRAANVLDAVQNNRHVERSKHENILARDQQYKVSIIFNAPSFYSPIYELSLFGLMQDAVEKMLTFDIHSGDLKFFFQELFPS